MSSSDNKIKKMRRSLQLRMHHKLCMKWITENHPDVKERLWEESKAAIKALEIEVKQAPMTNINYVQEVRPDATPDPSCHVCGAIMVRDYTSSLQRNSLALFGLRRHNRMQRRRYEYTILDTLDNGNGSNTGVGIHGTSVALFRVAQEQAWGN